MQQISNLPVFTGTIPNKATQNDTDFANNIFGFLNYSGNSFVRDFNVIVDEFNTLSDEIQTAEQSVSNYAGQAKTARDEALGALATLTAGAIDNTNKANNKAYSNIKVDELLDALDLSDISETTTLKHFTATLLAKLNGIAENANNYTHPSSHDASMINESITKRFVSDTEKASWNTVTEKASLNSPEFTENPKAPTQNPQDNSTKLATTAYVDGKFKRGIAVASTSGTAIDFTGIPSWAKRITIMFNGVSTNGGSTTVVRLGTSNSIESNGYAGVCANIGSTAASYSNLSSGFETLQLGGASIVQQGQLILSNISGNTWVASSMMGRSDNNFFGLLAGSKTLAGVLDRVRITTANGVDSFDAGSINIMYEG